MHKQRDEDLFRDSTMTFGEHLDELRSCLLKALFGLVLGFGLGLYLGDRVVNAITHPLEDALREYYKQAAEDDYGKWVEERKKNGEPIQYTLEEFTKMIRPEKGESMVPEVRYVHPKKLLDAIAWERKKEGKPAASTEDATQAVEEKGAEDRLANGEGENVAETAESRDDASTAEELSPIFLWQKISDDARTNPAALSVQEAFTFWLKASLVVGVIVSSPWIFYQIWTFVAAGLYGYEKRYVYIFLPFSLGLFLAGAALAYLFVFAPVLSFLLGFNRSLGLDPDPRISEWMSFVLFLPLGFGVSFQLPLVMLFLERLSILNVKMYLEKWRIAVLVIFVISAILTPADPVSIWFMAAPLTFLYFGGVLLCKWLPRRKTPFAVE